MSSYELEDKDGNRYRISIGAGPLLPHDENLVAGSCMMADNLLGGIGEPQIIGAFSHFYSSVNGLSGNPKDALSSALSQSYLVIEKLDSALAIDADVSDPRNELRIKIRQTLAVIIAQEQAQAAQIERELAAKSNLGVAAEYGIALGKGIGEAAWGLAVWLKDVNDVVNPVMRRYRQSQALVAAWQSDDFAKTYGETVLAAEKRELVEVLGFDPTQITMKQVDEAIAMTTLVMDDPGLQSILKKFALDYANAQHSIEITEIAGGGVFELILTIILAAVTGGAAAVASLGSKARLLGKFKKLGKLLTEFAEATKKIAKRAKKRNAKIDGDSSAPKFTDLDTVEGGSKKTDPHGAETGAVSKANNTSGATVPDDASVSGDSEAPAASEVGKTDTGKPSEEASKSSLEGEPINMVTGEELLELTDFTFRAPLPLTWRRIYRSTSTANRGLGYGWSHPLSERLFITNEQVRFVDSEGRNIPFERPKLQQASLNKVEKLTLRYLDATTYAIEAPGKAVRIFSAETDYQLTALIDASNNRLDFHYSEDAQLRRIQSSAGQALELSWADSLITQIDKIAVDGTRTLEVKYHYDFTQDLIACEDAGGKGEQYQYRNHVITQRTLKTGFNFYFEWDEYSPLARCTRQWGDNDIYSYRFEWDDTQRVSRAIDSNGGIKEFHYDDNAKVTKIVDPEGGVSQFQFDDVGNLLVKTEPSGVQHRYEYNEFGQLTRYRDPLGGGHQIEYQGDRPIVLIDGDGNRWTRDYYDNGLIRQITNPDGLSTHYTYNAQGLITEIRNPAGQVTKLTWDEQDRLLVEQSRELSRHFSYNARDQIEQVAEFDTNFDSQAEAAHARITRYDYDVSGNVTQVTFPDGKQQVMAYNANDQLISVTDTAGRTTQYRYDGLSQVREKIDPAGQHFKYQYDKERNLIGLINQNGEKYQLEYDRNERLVKEVGFDGRTQHYRYNSQGHLVAHVEGSHPDSLTAANYTTQFKRDALGRLLEKRCPDGETSFFSYSKVGQLLAANNNARQLSFEYTAAGLLSCERQDDQPLSHNYNALKQRTQTTLPAGQEIAYQYDNHNRWSGMSFDGQRVVDIDRDAWGRELQRFQGASASHFDYDPMGRLSSHQVTTQSGKHQLISRDYAYDDAGNLALVDDFRKGSTHYQYDALNQLKAVSGFSDEQFDFDPAGNLLSNSSSSSSSGSEKSQGASAQVKGNRLQFQGDRKFTYDDAGNLIRENRGKHGALETRYTYNAQNQLVRVDDGKQVTRYSYDALGRRISKEDSFGKTEFLWNGDVLLSEARASNEKIYLYEPNSFKPLAQIQDGEIYHYHLDHLGTPQEMTDNTGQIVWSSSYKAYGNLALNDVNNVENNLRFQGQYFDEETGLHYNRHRYFDPSVGQFTTQDPIGLLGGTNGYQYAPNPTSWIDPLGLKCKENTWNEFQKDHKGQFATVSEASKAYKDLKEQQSPWPIGYDHTSHVRTMKVGETFNMIVDEGADDMPGRFATFDDIASPEYGRQKLAIKKEWKSTLDNVVTYRVKKPFDVYEGPVGPQIDGSTYVAGGGTQITFKDQGTSWANARPNEFNDFTDDPYLEVAGKKKLGKEK
ncbi:RHS repeat-associated core domain-containing protein [Agaribacterium sp. ZY112]|uniref:RHS repeat-associated core domain-containing protein n=1 Tax=Agaribacterium sp. ZY112 TaxID=3233574 RepID=UPI0035264064